METDELGLKNKIGKLHINSQLNELGKAMASTMKAVKEIAEDQVKMRMNITDRSAKQKQKCESLGFTGETMDGKAQGNYHQQQPYYPRNSGNNMRPMNYYRPPPRETIPNNQGHYPPPFPYTQNNRYNTIGPRNARPNNYRGPPYYGNNQNLGYNRPRYIASNTASNPNARHNQSARDWTQQASPRASWCIGHKRYGPHCYENVCNGDNPECNFKKTFLE